MISNGEKVRRPDQPDQSSLKADQTPGRHPPLGCSPHHVGKGRDLKECRCPEYSNPTEQPASTSDGFVEVVGKLVNYRHNLNHELLERITR